MDYALNRYPVQGSYVSGRPVTQDLFGQQLNPYAKHGHGHQELLQTLFRGDPRVLNGTSNIVHRPLGGHIVTHFNTMTGKPMTQGETRLRSSCGKYACGGCMSRNPSVAATHIHIDIRSSRTCGICGA